MNINMIDAAREVMLQGVKTESTLYTLETLQEDTLWTATSRETSQPSHEELDHTNLVVIPTYNAAEWLTSLVRHLLQQGPFDLLLVDDCSPDGTGELAEQLAFLFPGRVDILHQPERLGAVAAYTAALRYALKRGYIMLFSLEGDYSQYTFSVPMLRCVLNKTGVVLSAGSEQSTRTCSFWRRLFSWGGREKNVSW